MPHAGFNVVGPFALKSTEERHRFSPANLRAFWDHVNEAEDEDVAEQVGCYVFAVRAPRAITPWYVGKTFNSFRAETFAADKERKYWRVLSGLTRSKGVWFFLPQQRTRGPINEKQILALERELIRRCQGRNPDLLNVRDLHRERWMIHGYDCSCRGPKPRAAAAFSLMLHGNE